MNSANDSGADNPDPKRVKLLELLLMTLASHVGGELRAHRELLYTLLDKNPDILQGSTPKDYIDNLVKSQTNKGLAGIADVSQPVATILANILLPKKKDAQDEPPNDEGKA